MYKPKVQTQKTLKVVVSHQMQQAQVSGGNCSYRSLLASLTRAKKWGMGVLKRQKTQRN